MSIQHLQPIKTKLKIQVMSDKSSTKSRYQSHLFWDAVANIRSIWRYWTSKTNFKTETKHTSYHSRKCCSNDPNFCSSRSPNFNKPFKYFLPKKISTENSQKYRIWTLSFAIHLLWPELFGQLQASRPESPETSLNTCQRPSCRTRSILF